MFNRDCCENQANYTRIDNNYSTYYTWDMCCSYN